MIQPKDELDQSEDTDSLYHIDAGRISSLTIR